MPEVALRRQLLDQLLERHLLVGVGRQRRLAHLRDERREAGIAGEAGAQGDRVDEEADQRLQLAAGAAGDRRAEDDVGLAGETVEEGGQAGRQGHEESRSGAPRQLAERFGLRAGKPLRLLVAAMGLDGRTPAVGGQLQESRGARELAAPVGDERRQRLAGEPPPLPEGEVAVLHGERRQDRAGGERPQLGEEAPHRPAVRDDVVHAEEEAVVAGGEAEERDAQERPVRQVVGAAGDVGGALRRGGLARGGRQRGQVLEGDVEVRLFGHPLHRLAVLLGEGGAQRLVARHDRPHRGRQRAGVERPGEPPGAGDVVGGVAGHQAVEEPEPLLREGEWDRHAGRAARDAVLGGRAAAQARFDGTGEAGEHRLLEERRQRHLGAGGVAYARQHLGRQERVAAEAEEVIAGADARHAHDLRPDAGQQLLQRRARRDVALLPARCELRLGQRAQIDLPVRGEGEAGQEHEGRRHHVVRQRGGEVGAERVGVDRLVVRHDVGDEPLVT